MNTNFGFAILSTLSLLLATVPIASSQDLKPVKCEGHETFVVSVAVSPDGKLVASDSDDQTLRFWKAADGKLLRTVSAADPLAKGGAGRWPSRPTTIWLWRAPPGGACSSLNR